MSESLSNHLSILSTLLKDGSLRLKHSGCILRYQCKEM